MRTVRRRTDWSSLLKELWFVAEKTVVRYRKNWSSLPEELWFVAEELSFFRRRTNLSKRQLRLLNKVNS